MSDEIDDIVIPSLGKYKDWDLKAVNRAGSDDELANEEEKKAAKEKEKTASRSLRKSRKRSGSGLKTFAFPAGSPIPRPVSWWTKMTRASRWNA